MTARDGDFGMVAYGPNENESCDWNSPSCCGVALGDGVKLDVLAKGGFSEASDARCLAEDA